MMTLPELLRADRARRGLRSDAAYAEALGVSFNTLRGWMGGRAAEHPLATVVATLLREINS